MIARHAGRTFVGAMALLVAVFSAGCGGSSATQDASTETTPAETSGAPTVEQAREAGTIAKAIEKEPNRTAEILAEHGMTAESLEALLYQIARDPKLTEVYEEAKGAGSSG